MRILHLRLKNLNSLVGEWNIDFTHPEYTNNGIFAITGPTGAGKSTLLDAICLALYGKTPRLDKISKSSNEIMARQTGECFSEVTFETAGGKYRCFWGQHRSHKKAGEKLQDARREIVDAVTNIPLECHLNKVEAKVEEITGMDFHRFTRSMLLAQGSFDVFLKAPPSERAPILEQITGTEIYTQISINAFERAKKEAKKLEELNAELIAIRPLSDEDEKKYAAEEQEKYAETVRLSKSLQILSEQCKWREEMDRVSFDLKELELKWALHLEEENRLRPELNQLEQAIKALNFEADFRDLCHLKQSRDDGLVNQNKSMVERSFLENSIREKNKSLEIYRMGREELFTRQKIELEIFNQVREIDKDLKREQNNLKELSLRMAKEEEAILVHRKIIEEGQSKGAEYNSNLMTIQAYFDNFEKDEMLIEKFSMLKENLHHCKEKNGLIRVKQEEAIASNESLDKAKIQVNCDLKDYTEALEKTEKFKAAFETLSKEHEAASRGMDALQWNNEIKKFLAQEQLLKEIIGLLERIQSSGLNQKSNLAAKQAFEEKLAYYRLEEERFHNEKIELDLKIETYNRHQAFQNRIQTLDEARSQLRSQEPCPLCGSLEHPFLEHDYPQVRLDDEKVNQAKNEIKELFNSLHHLAKEISRIETELAGCEKKQSEEIDLSIVLKKIAIELLSKAGCIQNEFPAIAEIKGWHNQSLEESRELEKDYNTFLKISKNREEAQQIYNKALQYSSRLKERLEEVNAAQNKLESHCHYLGLELESLLKDSAKIESFLIEALQPFGFTLTHDASEIEDRLFDRLARWKQCKNEHKRLEEEVQKELLQMTIQKGHLETAEKIFKQNDATKTKLINFLEELSLIRLQLFGNKFPDAEEERLNISVVNANAAFDTLKNECSRLQHRQESLKENIAGLAALIEEHACQLKIKEEAFINHIHQAGFPDLEAYQQASLDHETRSMLSKLKNDFEKRKAELTANKKASEKKLLQLTIELKTDETLDDLEKQFEKILDELEKVKERSAILKDRLAENEKKKIEARVVQDRIARQSKENEIWKYLSHLIGAADGKKFRDFAQKMTLEMMIGHTNRQLVKMSDRYLLKQSKEFPLELEVVDNYQAGEERSVKNLSGGEGFIVSLALALGLSQMSSSKVRLETLFLDEGFGTLDEQALEAALDTLSELHQEGKVIGLISHVAVLKERISTQIKIKPISGGRSRIEGPGCSFKQ
ncbi:MAG: AAA family ATPase [Candidatus Protochlamydia sp.]|nr:AAA family ATPase [Candidatus Protochlamydia sp.]